MVKWNERAPPNVQKGRERREIWYRERRENNMVPAALLLHCLFYPAKINFITTPRSNYKARTCCPLRNALLEAILDVYEPGTLS